jgi:hypothetical protein
MLRHPLLILPLTALLAAADGVALFHFAGQPHVLSNVSAFAGHGTDWLIHGSVAWLAAGMASAALPEATRLTRVTLFVLCLILAGVIPVAGVLITGALALILREPSTGGLRAEERFVFGNPEALAARRGSRSRPPLMVPLADAFRDMDEDTLCQAILGLRNLGPVPAIAPFLRRFQQDPRTAVQFTAQALIAGAVEELEETALTLRQRLTENAADHESRLALASVLARLSEWTPPGDATAGLYRRDAAALLQEIPPDANLQQRTLPLLAQLQLAASDGPSSMETLNHWAAVAHPSDPALHRALLEALFHQGRWDDLAAAAHQLPPSCDESQRFWTQSPDQPG